MDEIEVEGLRIAYERAGAGAPLVLVHGFVGDGRSTWSGQLEALADEFTVIAWDAPGAGRSSVPPESFRVQDYAACLVAFLRALEITRAHLAGACTVVGRGGSPQLHPHLAARRHARCRPRQLGGGARPREPRAPRLPPTGRAPKPLNRLLSSA